MCKALGLVPSTARKSNHKTVGGCIRQHELSSISTPQKTPLRISFYTIRRIERKTAPGGKIIITFYFIIYKSVHTSQIKEKQLIYINQTLF
jgi:hypothetical protein